MPFANNLFAAALVVGALHRSPTLLARYLRNAVGDEVHGIEASHLLHLQEVDRV